MCGVDLAELMNPVCRPSSPKGVFQQDPHKTKGFLSFEISKSEKYRKSPSYFLDTRVSR